MGYKKKEEETVRKHNPAKVTACIREYEIWTSKYEMCNADLKFYNTNIDIMGKYYPTFFDYFIEIHKETNWKENNYYEIFRDKHGNKQTMMYPTLDDNDNIVYRVRDPNYNIQNVTRIGNDEVQEETDYKANSVVIDLSKNFNQYKKN